MEFFLRFISNKRHIYLSCFIFLPMHGNHGLQAYLPAKQTFQDILNEYTEGIAFKNSLTRRVIVQSNF